MTNWKLDTPSKRSWFLVMLLGLGFALGSYALFEFQDHSRFWRVITDGQRGYGAYRQSFYLGAVLVTAGLAMSFFREWTWDIVNSWIQHGSAEVPRSITTASPSPHATAESEPPSETAARPMVDGFDLRDEAEKFFDQSSVSMAESPKIVILMGGVASGKTTMRKEKYGSGFVVVDAVEVFLNLSRGGYYPFPEHFDKPMNFVGRVVAATAVMERRNIVTEIIGVDREPTMQLIDAMTSIGYKVEVVGVTCDVNEAAIRNENREDDAISAYYAEPFQRAWLLEAVARNPVKS